MDENLGNIKKDSFREVWNSQKAIEARKNIKKLNCPHCWVECEAFKDIAMNKNILLKQFIKILQR